MSYIKLQTEIVTHIFGLLFGTNNHGKEGILIFIVRSPVISESCHSTLQDLYIQVTLLHVARLAWRFNLPFQ